MTEKKIHCSHCGCVDFSLFSNAPQLHRCSSCHGLTISLNGQWQESVAHAEPPIPLRPVLAFTENDFSCLDCESVLTVEMILRSALEPCFKCEDKENFTHKDAPTQNFEASQVSLEELAFLRELAPSSSPI